MQQFGDREVPLHEQAGQLKRTRTLPRMQETSPEPQQGLQLSLASRRRLLLVFLDLEKSFTLEKMGPLLQAVGCLQEHQNVLVTATSSMLVVVVVLLVAAAVAASVLAVVRLHLLLPVGVVLSMESQPTVTQQRGGHPHMSSGLRDLRLHRQALCRQETLQLLLHQQTGTITTEWHLVAWAFPVACIQHMQTHDHGDTQMEHQSTDRTASREAQCRRCRYPIEE